MKKLFLVAAIAAFGFTTYAQEVTFGAKAGVNFASITGDETDNLSGLTGFHIGAFADISVSDNFSVQPELLYSTQGAEYKDSGNYDGKFKFSYVNIPVMAKFEVADGFSLQAGPQVGFNTSAKDEYTYTGVDPGFSDDSGEEDIKDYIKGTDFAINFGVGYEMASGLNFTARYSIGVSNVNDYSSDVDPGFDLNEIKNQNSVIQLSVGYSFL